MRQSPPLRTYSHLESQRRVPTEYEIVTSELLYYTARGFEIQVPVGPWYERYQRGSALACSDWERFQDPRQTTYTSYTALQARQQVHLEGVARSWHAAEHDPRAVVRWRDSFSATLGPLRFALHGFQMIAAYLGQMAPSGRITIAALFQAADELRRVHAIAERLGELRQANPGAGEDSRRHWQSAEAWQPLRRALENALVAYDWGEALVALNLCLKPLVEGLFLTELGRLARQRQDFLVAELLSSFDEDARWHRAWSGALLELAMGERPENRGPIQGWVDRWYPPARTAARAAAALLGEGASATQAETLAQGWLESLGLKAP